MSSQPRQVGDDALDPRVRWVVPELSDARMRRVRLHALDSRLQEGVPNRDDPRLRAREDPEDLLADPWDPEGTTVPGTELDTGSAGHSSGPAPRIGLNRIQSYTPNVKYGKKDDSLEDAALLGVETVRMIGGGDLQWAKMAQASMKTSGSPGPFELVGAEVPRRPEDLLSPRADNWKKLAATLETLDTHGMRMVSVFLGDGGSGPKLSEMPAALRPSLDEGADPSWDDHGSEREELDSSTVLHLRWSGDHAGKRSPLTREKFPAPPIGSSSGRWAWHFQTLDVTSPYKREYLYHIAQASIRVLRQAADQAGVTSRISEVVEAIETLNEIDVANQRPSMADAGEDWGRAYLHAAWGLRTALSDEFGTAGDAVRLKLPGVASYVEGASGFEWADKLEFWEGFAYGMAVELGEQEKLVYGDQGLAPGSLADLAQGIDYHWYHRNTTTGTQLAHIGLLSHEITELRDALKAGFESGLRTILDPGEDPKDYLPDLPVSVYETGTSVTDALPTEVTWSGGGPFDPGSSYTLSESSGAEQQARDLVRRVGGALASGAEVAGWHAWMDMATGTFTGTGLRDDSWPESSSPGTGLARRSRQLWSWFVFQRLAEYLGGGRVRYGRVLLPDSTSRSDLEAMLASGDPSVGLVVFEYFLTEPAARAYLVLLDPAAVQDVPIASVTVQYELRKSARGSVVEVPLRPVAIPPRRRSSVAVADTALPYVELPFPRSRVRSLPRIELLEPGDWPLLLISKERLRFLVAASS